MVRPENTVTRTIVKLPFSNPVFLFLALTGAAVADVPKKAPLARYTELRTNSPFTSKPAEKVPARAQDLLADYSLIGVAPLANDGFRVTLIDRKKPEERTTVFSDRPNDLFEIIDVTPKSGDPLATVVRMRMGDSIGTVGFDSKLLMVAPKITLKEKATPVVKAAPSAHSTPRSRVVPPTQ